MPRDIPPALLSLIQSSGYPPLPNISDLEQIRSTLIDYSDSISRPIPSPSDEALRIKKEKKRKEREDEERERAAIEANEKAGLKLEANEKTKLPGSGPSREQAAEKKSGVSAGKTSPGVKVKRERASLSPAPSNASTAASFKPSQQPYGPQMKKKKIKRVIDSDDEALATRDRSAMLASPQPYSHPNQSTTSGLKLKLPNAPKSRPSLSVETPPPISATGLGSHIDFSLPQPARPLVPIRTEPKRPMPAGPKKQSEVDEDYSNKKAPNQVAFPTFWSAIEPYLRDIREDDLAMLNFKTDPSEAYEIPSKGRHYTEVWDEEDGNPPGTRTRVSVPNLRQQQLRKHVPSAGLTLPHFIPAQEMRDENLFDEQRGLGCLTERVVAAVVGLGRPKDDKEQRLGQTGEEIRLEPVKIDLVNMEERMKSELKAVMLLGEHEEFDPNNRDDDEVSAALRQCQRLLAAQTALNDTRKARIAEIAKQRLAYADYRAALDGVEKSIEEAWAKRLKKYGISPKKPSMNGEPGAIVGDHGEMIQLNPSGRPPVPEPLKRLVETRKNWLSSVGQVIKSRPRGELLGIPETSVYKALENKDNVS
ncbi:hypothetical protein L204_104257 [Cryptococcus depauperatus]|nr:hypothetical protein L204_04918 [Cryptococcus depauperatus CBS 7855]